MLYTSYDFKVYFSKIFCHSGFLDKSGPIIWVSSNWLKFRKGLYCYMLITVLMFIFSKIFSFILFRQICSQNLKSFKLTEIWYRARLLYAYFDFDVYFFNIFVSHIFLGKFGLKILSSPNWQKFRRVVHYNMLITILMLVFQKFCHWYNLGQNLMLSQLTEIWHLCILLII